MLVLLRPEAEQELLEAQAWYESKALGLGFEFARAADAAVASALRNPLGYLRIEEEFRWVLFRKFPYMLIQARMNCWWFRSFISIVSLGLGWSGLAAEAKNVPPVTQLLFSSEENNRKHHNSARNTRRAH